MVQRGQPNRKQLGDFLNAIFCTNAEKTKIRDLDLNEKGEFYYLFDFGDDWWHELSVLNFEDESGSKRYPKITKKVGKQSCL
ncbi:MAG: hypothetical protein JRK53_18195 [Deltaproteobacteria bacterium]|nr:hypothetical protein [Deltaproteobacteria bacterium]